MEKKSKTKKTFKRKDEDVRESESGDVDFHELVAAAKEIIPDIFVPEEGCDSLLQVSDWIDMPSPIAEIMGVQGFPCGHIVEIFGKQDSGKTTLATHALIGAQKDGGIGVLIDTEHKFNIERAIKMGLDRSKFIITRANTIESAFEKYVNWMKLIKSKPQWANRKVCFVWDSVGATPCQNEIDESTKDHNMKAAQAITAGLRRTRYFLRKCNAAFIMINQVTHKQTNTSFEKKTTSKGGLAPKYFSSIRIECSKIAKIYETSKGVRNAVGIDVKVDVVKNHLAPPFKSARVKILETGIVEE